MIKSDEYLESRIKWRAERQKLPSENAHFFDKINPIQKLEFENLLKGTDIGIPVLLFNGEDNRWTIVATKKVISGTFSEFEAINYSEITNHTVGDLPFIDENSESDERDDDEFNKVAQNKILLKSKDGEIITLNTSKGTDLYALYSILIMLIRTASAEN